MRLHVHEWGPSMGRTVVALHGTGSSGRVFRRLADRLPDLRIVAPDLRGNGASRDDPPWDLSVHLRDVRETLDAMGIARAPCIGFSFGGRLAVELLAMERSRIERLILLEPALRMSPARAAAGADYALRNDPSYASVDEAIEARVASRFAPYAPREHWERWAEGLVRGEDGRLRLPFSRAAVITMYSELATPPPPFEQLRVPTLLITGAESDLVTMEQIERYRDGLGHLLETRIVRAKHHLIADAADDVAAAIDAFLLR